MSQQQDAVILSYPFEPEILDLSPVVWKIYDPALKSMGTLCEGLNHLMDHFLIPGDFPPFSFHKGILFSKKTGYSHCEKYYILTSFLTVWKNK